MLVWFIQNYILRSIYKDSFATEHILSIQLRKIKNREFHFKIGRFITIILPDFYHLSSNADETHITSIYDN